MNGYRMDVGEGCRGRAVFSDRSLGQREGCPLPIAFREDHDAVAGGVGAALKRVVQTTGDADVGAESHLGFPSTSGPANLRPARLLTGRICRGGARPESQSSRCHRARESRHNAPDPVAGGIDNKAIFETAGQFVVQCIEQIAAEVSGTASPLRSNASGCHGSPPEIRGSRTSPERYPRRQRA